MIINDTNAALGAVELFEGNAEFHRIDDLFAHHGKETILFERFVAGGITRWELMIDGEDIPLSDKLAARMTAATWLR